MSATATRRDAVTADVACRFRSGQRESKLLLHRAGQKPAHAVLLPVCCLHHLFDTSPRGLTQQCQQALLLGNSLDLWYIAFAAARGIEAGLGGGRSGRDLAASCRVDVTLLFLDAAVLSFGTSRWKGLTWSGLLGSRRQNWRSHDPKPRTSRGEPLMGGLARPAHNDTNAYYAAEVQSVLRPQIRSHVLCKPAPTHHAQG